MSCFEQQPDIKKISTQEARKVVMKQQLHQVLEVTKTTTRFQIAKMRRQRGQENAKMKV